MNNPDQIEVLAARFQDPSVDVSELSGTIDPSKVFAGRELERFRAAEDRLSFISSVILDPKNLPFILTRWFEVQESSYPNIAHFKLVLPEGRKPVQLRYTPGLKDFPEYWVGEDIALLVPYLPIKRKYDLSEALSNTRRGDAKTTRIVPIYLKDASNKGLSDLLHLALADPRVFYPPLPKIGIPLD